MRTRRRLYLLSLCGLTYFAPVVVALGYIAAVSVATLLVGGLS